MEKGKRVKFKDYVNDLATVKVEGVCIFFRYILSSVIYLVILFDNHILIFNKFRSQKVFSYTMDHL